MKKINIKCQQNVAVTDEDFIKKSWINLMRLRLIMPNQNENPHAHHIWSLLMLERLKSFGFTNYSDALKVYDDATLTLPNGCAIVDYQILCETTKAIKLAEVFA